jgi:hypothetical protein
MALATLATEGSNSRVRASPHNPVEVRVNASVISANVASLWYGLDIMQPFRWMRFR